MSTKFKTKVEARAGLSIPTLTSNRAVVTDGNSNVIESATTAAQVGYLSNLTSDVQNQIDGKISNLEKGAANGVATLDGAGKVPTAQLPSYVDDVVEFADLASFPVTGETSKIYVALDSNKTYRWSGSVYIEISPSEVNSVFGRTGVVTAQNGDYTASQITNIATGNISATTVQDAINELDSEKQPLDPTLTALAAYNTNGILTQTSADTFTGRTITGTASNISVSNGDGVAGNPTIDLVDTAVTAGSYGSASDTLIATVDAKGRLTSLVATPIAIDASQVSGISPNDIATTSFLGANNQISAANITGLAFNPAVVRSAQILISVSIDATSDLFEATELLVVNNGTSWVVSEMSTGDDTQIVYSITNGGQVQYTSGNYAGFNTLKFSFRAITTLV